MVETNFYQQNKWKMLSFSLMGLIAAIGVAAFFGDQKAYAPPGPPPVTASDVVCSGCVDTADIHDGAVKSAKIAQGAVGINVVTRTDTVDVPPGAVNTARAVCHSGETIVGGGFNGGRILHMDESAPAAGNAWEAAAENTSTDLSSTMQAFAQCATITP